MEFLDFHTYRKQQRNVISYRCRARIPGLIAWTVWNGILLKVKGNGILKPKH